MASSFKSSETIALKYLDNPQVVSRPPESPIFKRDDWGGAELLAEAPFRVLRSFAALPRWQHGEDGGLQDHTARRPLVQPDQDVSLYHLTERT